MTKIINARLYDQYSSIWSMAYTSADLVAFFKAKVHVLPLYHFGIEFLHKNNLMSLIIKHYDYDTFISIIQTLEITSIYLSHSPDFLETAYKRYGMEKVVELVKTYFNSHYAIISGFIDIASDQFKLITLK